MSSHSDSIAASRSSPTRREEIPFPPDFLLEIRIKHRDRFLSGVQITSYSSHLGLLRSERWVEHRTNDHSVRKNCAQFCAHHQTRPSATSSLRNVSKPKFSLHL